MDPRLKKIQTFFREDKRLSERLTLPVDLAYALADLPLDVASSEWIRPIHIENIGGDGAGLITKDFLEPDQDVSLKLKLPRDDRAMIFLGHVVWCRKIIQAENDKQEYATGLKFHGMNFKDRQRFVTYMTDHILARHLEQMNLSGDHDQQH